MMKVWALANHMVGTYLWYSRYFFRLVNKFSTFMEQENYTEQVTVKVNSCGDLYYIAAQ